MSTNFYAKTPEMSPDEEGLHIGQRAAGSEFLFRAHRELGLTTSEAWHEYLSRPGVRIVAEYGVEYELREFWQEATLRPRDVGGLHRMNLRWRGESAREGQWRDVSGHPFAAYEFC